ncbi:hypothetical protein EDB19DRAFT_727888 [Suillus lakei]|nr:hypothetical protein EDB19DRAFT_727888 [Suillus lakei]
MFSVTVLLFTYAYPVFRMLIYLVVMLLHKCLIRTFLPYPLTPILLSFTSASQRPFDAYNTQLPGAVEKRDRCPSSVRSIPGQWPTSCLGQIIPRCVHEAYSRECNSLQESGWRPHNFIAFHFNYGGARFYPQSHQTHELVLQITPLRAQMNK